MPRAVQFLSAIALFCLATGASAGTIETISEKNEIKLGFRTDAAPYSYANKGGVPSGFMVELCKLVVTGLRRRHGLKKLKIKWVPVTTKGRFEALKSGKIDLHCGAATVTLSRRKIVDFSVLTFLTGPSVMVMRGGPGSFAEFKGKKVGVRAATTTEKFLRGVLKTQGINAQVVTVSDHREGLKKLESKEIAAYVGDRFILLFLKGNAKQPGNLGVSKRMFEPEPLALVLRRGDPEFRLSVDWTLSRIYRSGAIRDVFKKVFKTDKTGQMLGTLYMLNALPD